MVQLAQSAIARQTFPGFPCDLSIPKSAKLLIYLDLSILSILSMGFTHVRACARATHALPHLQKQKFFSVFIFLFLYLESMESMEMLACLLALLAFQGLESLWTGMESRGVLA